MNKKILTTAAVFGVLAIILGAFGAHALKKVLTVEQLTTFETGVKYQMYHALFLLFLGSNTIINESSKKLIFTLILTGMLLFSGSIYFLATTTITQINFKPIGILTPIGGIFLIAGWALFCVKLLKNNS